MNYFKLNEEKQNIKSELKDFIDSKYVKLNSDVFLGDEEFKDD